MEATAYTNHNRETCLVFDFDLEEGIFKAIATNTQGNKTELAVTHFQNPQFEREWHPIVACNAQNAASIYLNGFIPFNFEVKSILEKIMGIDVQETKAAGKAQTEKQIKAAEAAAEKGAKTVVKKGAGKSGDVKVTKPAGKATDKAAKFFKEQEAKVAAKAPAKKEGDAKPSKEKKEGKPRAPKEDLSMKTIKKLPLPEGGRRGNAESVRTQCYNIIAAIKGDTVPVKKYLEAASKAGIEAARAVDELKKLSNPAQKNPSIELV